MVNGRWIMGNSSIIHLFTGVSIIQHITMSLRARKGEAIPEFARSLLRRAIALLAMTEVVDFDVRHSLQYSDKCLWDNMTVSPK